MKNFLEMPDDQKKKIIKEAVHESNWAQVKIVYKKELDKEICKASKHQLELVRDEFNLDSEDIDELNDRIKQLEKGE